MPIAIGTAIRMMCPVMGPFVMSCIVRQVPSVAGSSGQLFDGKTRAYARWRTGRLPRAPIQARRPGGRVTSLDAAPNLGWGGVNGWPS